MSTLLSAAIRVRPCPSVAPALYTINHAAQLLSLHPRTLRDYIAQGLLPVVRLPHKGGKDARRQSLRIHHDDLNTFITQCRPGRIEHDPHATESVADILNRLGEEWPTDD